MDTSTQNNVINIRKATLNGPKITQTDLDEKVRAGFFYCHGLAMNAIANMRNASPDRLPFASGFETSRKHTQYPECHNKPMLSPLNVMRCGTILKRSNSGFRGMSSVGGSQNKAMTAKVPSVRVRGMICVSKIIAFVASYLFRGTLF